GTLYASRLDTFDSPATASLVTINTVTGAVTELGPTVNRLDAIVFDSQFPAANLSLTLGVNQATVAPGVHLQFGITAANYGRAAAFDIFSAILLAAALSVQLGCPAGDGIAFLTNGFATVQQTCISTASLSSVQPLFGIACVPGALPQTAFPN